MKSFYLSFMMIYTATTLLMMACEEGGINYNQIRKIELEVLDSNSFMHLFQFKVSARQWRKLSSSDRYVEMEVPEIDEETMNKGAVFIYLCEAGKTVALPFTYYQVRRAMCFQPSYEPGRAYVNLLGDFIVNTHTSFHFRLLVINERALKKFKSINWQNYEEVINKFSFRL